MIKCSSCGKELVQVPSWLNEVNVKVVCNNCPNRDLKSITEIKLENPADKLTENATGGITDDAHDPAEDTEEE